LKCHDPPWFVANLAAGPTSHDQELGGVADEVNPAITNSIKLKTSGRNDIAVRKMAGRETLRWLTL
jgi:hypothetical protein